MKYEKYDARADLWSVGAIAYEMVFGSPPFRAENHVHLLRVIEAADDLALKFPSSLTFKQPMRRSPSNISKFSKDKQAVITVNIETSDVFRDLITNLLKKDPNKRISFEDFFSHPFIYAAFSKIPSSHDCRDASVNIPATLLHSSASSQSHRNSQSTIDEVLKIEDETNSLLELFDSLDHKPPVFTHMKYFKHFIYFLFIVNVNCKELFKLGFHD